MKADDAPLDKVTLWRVRFERMCLCAILFSVHQPAARHKANFSRTPITSHTTHTCAHTHIHTSPLSSRSETLGIIDVPSLFCQFLRKLEACFVHCSDELRWLVEGWRVGDTDQITRRIRLLKGRAEGERCPCPLVITERSRNFDQETSTGGGALWHFI